MIADDPNIRSDDSNKISCHSHKSVCVVLVAGYIIPRVFARAYRTVVHIIGVVTVAALMSCCTRAESADPEAASLKRLRLAASDGSIRLVYSRSSTQTALRYQKALEPAHKWFEKQLNLKVPATLAVLDEEDWARVTSIPMPHADGRSGTMYMREHLEKASSFRPPGIDVALAGEGALFHELGHIYFEKLNIQGSGFVNEMVPNIFMAAYIHEARSDLAFMLQGPFPSMPAPRYTSGADFIYLREFVGVDNYFWFQMHLQRLADYCLKNDSFPAVIAKLQSAFPGGRSYQLPIEDTVKTLDGLFPGFAAAAGSLAGPSTIRPIQPVGCTQVPGAAADTTVRLIVIRNFTPDRIEMTRADGKTETADAGAWRRFGVKGSLRLRDGTCLTPEAEPVLAVLRKPVKSTR